MPMNHASELNNPDLAILITGRIGHRGIELDTLLSNALTLRSRNPSVWVGLSTSENISSEDLATLDTVIDRVICIENSLLDLPHAMQTLQRQTSQVTELLKTVPKRVTSIVRIRTDWSVLDAEKFFSSAERATQSEGGFGIVDVNGARMPWLPMPWQGNDYVTCGSREKVGKFWEEFEPEDMRLNSGVSKFFSKALYFYNLSPVITVEQMLFRRFFIGRPVSTSKKLTSLSELASSQKNMSSLLTFSPSDFGVSPPPGVVSSVKILRNYFYNLKKLHRLAVFSYLELLASWVSANVLFFWNPIWIGSRLRSRKL
jgi:hypothetical protein